MNTILCYNKSPRFTGTTLVYIQFWVIAGSRFLHFVQHYYWFCYHSNHKFCQIKNKRMCIICCINFNSTNYHQTAVPKRGQISNYILVPCSPYYIVKSVIWERTHWLHYMNSYLATGLSSTILSPLFEPSIPVCSNYSVIKPGTIYISHGIFSIFSCIISNSVQEVEFW